jgi:hypothetical protein
MDRKARALDKDSWKKGKLKKHLPRWGNCKERHARKKEIFI